MKNKLPKINIENYLHDIDRTFATKTQQEIYMTYIMIFGVIFSIAYFLFWDSSLKDFQKTRASVVSYQDKIRKDKQFLQIHPKMKIIQLNKETISINARLIQAKDNNEYIRSKIDTIASLIYDERTWGEYLDSISRNAQRYHVQLKQLTNTYAKKGGSFGHILNITVNATANYKHTLSFINSLEQSDLVVDIHDINISAQKTLNTQLKLSVWGITYE